MYFFLIEMPYQRRLEFIAVKYDLRNTSQSINSCLINSILNERYTLEQHLPKDIGLLSNLSL